MHAYRHGCCAAHCGITKSPKYAFFLLHYPGMDFRTYEAHYQKYKQLQFLVTDPRTHSTIILNQSYVKYDSSSIGTPSAAYTLNSNESVFIVEPHR
jgi:hypothetical protein